MLPLTGRPGANGAGLVPLAAGSFFLLAIGSLPTWAPFSSAQSRIHDGPRSEPSLAQ
jgi:hypothetical protein